MEKVAKVAKVAKEYFCESCNYKSSNKTNFEKHLTTLKHKKRVLEISGNEKVADVVAEKIICENCERVFKTNSGLWKHKNKSLCKEVSKNNKKNQQYKELFIVSNKKNQQYEELLMEANKKNKILDKTVKEYEIYDRDQVDKISELRKKQLDLEYQIIKLKRRSSQD